MTIAHVIPHRSSTPVLKGEILEYLYEIMVLCESDKKLNIANNFKSEAVNRYLSSKDADGKPILTFSADISDNRPLNISELRYKPGKNKGIKLLINLRNAFAHNRITIEKGTEILKIDNYYQGRLIMRGRIKFSVLRNCLNL